ncbi:odorant receptor 22c-like [Episyrphus balteatus]|uniref:odorant receptor 22c-like n=1 Tax=Episyrphus balteatus TaxID=286459 RepID=UPI0024859167|nr:odorant receptor 22c-like [Episyrphus balteatus]
MTQIGNKPLYLLIYCFLVHSSTITCFALCAIDGMILCFCMYISGAYQCLQEDLKFAFKNYASRGLNIESSDLLYNDIKELIRRQQNIIEIFKGFNKSCKSVIFIHIAVASVSLGSLLINIRLTPGVAKVMYLNYIIGASTLVFIYCFASESVNQNCLKLSESLYFCDWYNCNKKVATLILFALAKSQSGCYMTAPFFSPSLPLFASIIQKSASYFTILETFL